MIIIAIFAFLSGFVTVLSPCVLPVLPIVLSSSAASGKKRPLGIIMGLVISFSLFTLAITQIVAIFGISPNTLRIAAVFVIAFLGASMVIPALNQWIEKLLGFLPRMASGQSNTQDGFFPGFITGLSLGLVWAPCAGPILASVTALAATQSVNFAAVLIVISYAIGSGIPLIAIAYGGRSLINRIPFLTRNTQKIQKIFGIVMILTAILIAFNADILVTTWLTEQLPENFTNTLTAFETSDVVLEQLDQINGASDNAGFPPRNEEQEPDLRESLPILGPSPEIDGIVNWINSEPIQIADLEGKIVLIDFWTYSCVNCVRTLPYLTDWHTKYADDGLVIIGIHTPEFAFEKEVENVQEAVERFKIEYPVALDNDYRTWRAFNNRYWPAKYLIDAAGDVRYTHFGEGDYEETEIAIQQLLKQAGATPQENISSAEQSSYSSQQTPELYVGFGRQEYFASPQPVIQNEPSTYSFPETLPADHFAVDGEWIFFRENARTAGSSTQLKLNFYGKDVFLVLDSPQPASINVILLGENAMNQSPDIIDEDGTIPVDGARLYHLVALENPTQAFLQIEFNQPDIEVYAFTFGS